MTPDSCYKFENEKITFKTSESLPKPLVFKPTHLKVEGKVHLGSEKQSESVRLVVLDASTAHELKELKLKKLSGTQF